MLAAKTTKISPIAAERVRIIHPSNLIVPHTYYDISNNVSTLFGSKGPSIEFSKTMLNHPINH